MGNKEKLTETERENHLLKMVMIKNPMATEKKRSYSKDSSERKPYGDREKRPYSKEGDERKSFGERRSFSKPFSEERKPYKREERSFDNESSYEKRSKSEDDGYIKDVTSENKKPYKGSFYDKQDTGKKTFTRKDSSSEEGDSYSDDRKKKSYEQFDSYERKGAAKPKRQRIEKTSFASQSQNEDGLIRLNKFIANSGVCSRREADKLIESGAVSVNGKIVSELGYKVKPEDEVHYGGTPIKTRETCLHFTKQTKRLHYYFR
jgi:23S rRNA pseudouridine2605 synthase